MAKFVEFLKSSNRYKHLIGGFLVGLLSLGAWNAIYSVVVAATCLELKDHLKGGWFDWTDWVFTFVGGWFAAAFWILVPQENWFSFLNF